jgi:hypothetical protein
MGIRISHKRLNEKVNWFEEKIHHRQFWTWYGLDYTEIQIDGVSTIFRNNKDAYNYLDNYGKSKGDKR